MRDIQCVLTGSQIQVNEYNTRVIKDAVRENEGPIRAHICFNLPESPKLRRYFHGALIRVWVYLDGGDWKDKKTCDRYFDIFMLENFPEVQKINGKIYTFGKSSKGAKMLNTCTEKLTDMLCEHYGLRHDSPVFVTENFKKWRDELRSFSNEDYIEYLVRMKIIDKNKML